MVIDNKFDMKQVVYLVTDPDQLPRMVVGIQACADGGILYKLACGTSETSHYDAEISAEKDTVKAL